jgi:hypothetical protein
MTLEATRMALKAKLANKGRLRPHEMICKKMPDGTGSLQDLPMRAHGAAAEDEAADGEYCKAIDRVTAVFGKQNRGVPTELYTTVGRAEEKSHLMRRDASVEACAS